FQHFTYAWMVWPALTLLIVSWRRHNLTAVVFILIFGLTIGWWRGSIYAGQLAAHRPFYYHKVTISARAINDGIYSQHSQLAFDASHILINGQAMVGKLQVSGFGANAIFQGDEVTVTGKLYPSHGSYQGRVSFAKIELVARHPSWVGEL